MLHSYLKTIAMTASNHPVDYCIRKEITPLSWEKHLREKAGSNVKTVENYFYMSEDVGLLPLFPYPFRIDVSIIILCNCGKLRGMVGLKPFEICASSLIVLPAGEIVQFDEVSGDLEGMFCVLSKSLSDDLFSNIKERLQLSMFTHANPALILDDEELARNTSYFKLLEQVLEDSNNPHMQKIILHLLLSLYYQQHAHFADFAEKTVLSRQEKVFLDFIRTVRKNYRRERQVGFYADELNLTPKYLSMLVKQYSGKSANDWIDEYVILDAKALLKSSSLTIQQISVELNFADQSSFGKYFKAHESVSPKEYRAD